MSVLLLKALLLERRVCVIGQDPSSYTGVCCAAEAMIRPFRWAPHIFLPLLPETLADLLCSPTPFLVGASSRLARSLPQLETERVLVLDLEQGGHYWVGPGASNRRLGPSSGRRWRLLGRQRSSSGSGGGAASRPLPPLRERPRMLRQLDLRLERTVRRFADGPGSGRRPRSSSSPSVSGPEGATGGGGNSEGEDKDEGYDSLEEELRGEFELERLELEDQEWLERSLRNLSR